MKRNFDLLALPYRWMEYSTFGRSLERCRFRFLHEFYGVRDVLVLGDGDGRFTARLLAAAPQARVVAVDSSPGMLSALRTRCEALHAGERVTACLADLTQGLPHAARERRYDLVASHFFLDCLTEAEIERLATQLPPLLEPNACWLVSDFNVPANWLRRPARILIRALYTAFRVLTGLSVQCMPDYASVLNSCGYVQREQDLLLRGLLVAQVWVKVAAATVQPVE